MSSTEQKAEGTLSDWLADIKAKLIDNSSQWPAAGKCTVHGVTPKGSQVKFISLIRGVSFNTLRLRRKALHFADDIFKCIFLYENVWIPIKISLKFDP